MKKFYLFTALCLITAWAFSQQVPRDKVVLEIGTGTWCYYCPGAAMGADDMIANGHDVAVIEYHSGDPFQNSYATARISYYGMSGFPTAKFDGVLTKVGGNHTQSMYSQYLALYNQRIVIPSSFTLSINGNNTGLNYDVMITADKVASFTGTNLVLHLALTESEIPYNWQGMNELNFVERLMVPNQNGTPLDFSAQSTQVVNLNFTLNSSWNENHCELVAFIQNNSNKEILQATKVALADLMPAYSVDAALDEMHGVPQTSCTGTCAPSVMLRNGGSDALVSADIMYSVNGGPLSSHTWNGNLGFMEQAMVDLPSISFTVQPVNTMTAYVTNPNGTVDQNPSNDTTYSDFVQATETTSALYLELLTDDNPEETTWELTDATGNVLYSGGPYTGMPNTLIQETFALSDEDCYSFRIYDDGGNGICCDNGNGSYQLNDYFGNVFLSGGDFAYSEINDFMVSGMILDLKVYLEGPYSGTEMYRFLNTYGYMPLAQPYNTAPWNYNGPEAVTSIPNIDIVEWILVELRETPGGPETATGSTVIDTRAAFLLRDGKVVDMDGTSPLEYNLTINDNLHVVIWHRNHLGVMSAMPLVPMGRVYMYDFSSGVGQAYGGAIAHKDMGNGVYGMLSGDGFSDGQVGNGDKLDVWSVQAGNSGYLQGDFDLNSNTDNQDKVEAWAPNSGLGCQVPD